MPANFGEFTFQRLSGKSLVDALVTYAVRHGEQEIPHGSVRARMALHPPASARAHRARTPQAARLTGDPRRRLLRTQKRLPLAVVAEGVPSLEERLRLVQEMANRRHLGAAERRAARASTVSPRQGPEPQRRYCGFSVR